MSAPTPTATERQIQRDGRLLIRLMRTVAKVRLPEVVEVAPDRPTLAAGNHRSLFDVFLSAAVCASADVSCRFLVQASYFERRFAGRWLRRIGCIPLNSATKDDAFAEASASLRRHELIGIMPEGRLIPASERAPQTGPGRPGVSELALSVGAIIQPIAFHRTDLVWPRGGWPRPRLRRPIVTVALGEPFELTSTDHQQNADRVMAVLTAMLDDLDATTPLH